MRDIRFAQGIQITPRLSPQDLVATATPTEYIPLEKANWLTILLQFGNIASTDDTGGVVVTVEASTDGSSNATEEAIPFQYRLSAAVGTESMGAVTDATAAGATIDEGDDNKLMVIDIDPSAVAASGADRKFVRVVVTPTAEVTATLVGAISLIDTRYKGNSIPSST